MTTNTAAELTNNSSLLTIKTLAQLQKSNYKFKSVKEEIRDNLIKFLKYKKNPFPGIIGYENTVIPALENAILSKHDFILLGLRGQAKSRIMRQLTNLLDEYLPIVQGCLINDSPLKPTCKRCQKLIKEKGSNASIEWLHKSRRYNEKLATPDVTVSDLIGDIDPIKAANLKLALSDEEVIHYGLIPRTNRGIFGINELPDLNTRIQVSLLNILEERDVQFRGFPIRMNLDILLVFTANPEDYTNRGTIITPLKDRIDSQIITHYPLTLEAAKQITTQESWINRREDIKIYFPEILINAIEEVTFEARKSELVDHTSGVSQRVSISAIEAVYSNAEKRAIKHDLKETFVRIVDLYSAAPSLIGKIQLVYEGEQKGLHAVAKKIIGRAINNLFARHFPPVYNNSKLDKKDEVVDDSIYNQVVGWFTTGKTLEISDISDDQTHTKTLQKISGLSQLVNSFFPKLSEFDRNIYSELLLEGLYQNSLIGKEELDNSITYKDVLQTML